jgi:predicted membrane channel-forming protein YqfA (hemolysin III family)
MGAMEHALVLRCARLVSIHAPTAPNSATFQMQNAASSQSGAAKTPTVEMNTDPGPVFALDTRHRLNHALWHLYVLPGSALHFFAVLACTLTPR